MNPATVLAEIEKAEAEQMAKQAAAAEGAAQAAAESGSAPPETEAPETEAPDASAAAVPPIRFTVRNEILHGPVLWPASLGIARVNTKVVWSEDIRRKLIEVFATDEPLRVSSRVGFLGGGSDAAVR